MPNRFKQFLIVASCAAMLGGSASAGKWKNYHRWQRSQPQACPQPVQNCPPGSAGTVPTEPGAAVARDEAAPAPHDEPAPAPGDALPATPAPIGGIPAQQPLNQFAQPQYYQTASSSAQSIAPNMIGDLFDVGSSAVSPLLPGQEIPGSVVGRQKVSENSSPMPRDRVFLNYSYFDNVPIQRGGADIHRFTPGFEKTFAGGNMSVELRVPFASTLDSTIRQRPLRTGENETELGNMAVYFKALLLSTETFALSTGLGVTLPTADDRRFITNTGVVAARIENDSYHVLPYLGALYTPNDRFFAQGFVQFDIDANGNRVFENGVGKVGSVDDEALLYVDLGVGYWLLNDFYGSGRIRGVAAIAEIHYNASITNEDSIVRPGRTYGNTDDLDLVNAVFGMTAAVGDSSQLTLGYTLPVQGADEQFDSEIRLIYNVFFGGSNGNGYGARRYTSY